MAGFALVNGEVIQEAQYLRVTAYSQGLRACRNAILLDFKERKYPGP